MNEAHVLRLTPKPPCSSFGDAPAPEVSAIIPRLNEESTLAMSTAPISRIAPDVPAIGPGRVPRIAIVVPCHNESSSIAKVVADFRSARPDAEIIVVDNASDDDTASIARQAGATVVQESRLGKGFALLTGFAHAAQADYCVMVDGDDTYPAEDVNTLIETAITNGADVVVGTRLESNHPSAFRPGHSAGNRFFNSLVRVLFGIRTRDLFSGYRVLSRRFLDTIPLVAVGFDVEAELSVQAKVNRFRVVEVPVHYRARGEKSHSKLRTVRDGCRILRSIILLFRDYRPIACFGGLSAMLAFFSLWSGYPAIDDYLRDGYVYHLPRAVLAAALFVLSALSLSVGVLLSSIHRRSNELAALMRKMAH